MDEEETNPYEEGSLRYNIRETTSNWNQNINDAITKYVPEEVRELTTGVARVIGEGLFDPEEGLLRGSPGNVLGLSPIDALRAVDAVTVQAPSALTGVDEGLIRKGYVATGAVKGIKSQFKTTTTPFVNPQGRLPSIAGPSITVKPVTTQQGLSIIDSVFKPKRFRPTIADQRISKYEAAKLANRFIKARAANTAGGAALVGSLKDGTIEQTTQAFAAKRTGGYTKGADDIDVDAIGLDGLNETFNKSNLGYDPTKLSTTPYKTRVKAQDGTVMPTDIATVYVRNAEAFLKANPGKTLEDFPNMWWHGEPWVIHPRKVYKTVNGERVLDKTKIGIDSWIKRKGRKKLAQTKRTQRLKEQSEGVKKGTAAYEKVRQLRKRNVERVEAGLPPLRLRDSDLDHVNALRSVDYYTEGMPENLTKLIYEDLGREGLFTGDHASNLKLREREVHRSLWPILKERLKELGHKHTGFKSPEARYKYYTEIDPKTEISRLQRYAEIVYSVEELGDDMMKELLTVAKQKKLKGSPKVAPSDPVKDALIKILGSEEDYKVFMDRLREYPEKMRRDFILEEIKYNE